MVAAMPLNGQGGWSPSYPVKKRNTQIITTTATTIVEIGEANQSVADGCWVQQLQGSYLYFSVLLTMVHVWASGMLPDPPGKEMFPILAKLVLMTSYVT